MTNFYELIDRLIHSFIFSLIDSFIFSLIDWLIDWLIFSEILRIIRVVFHFTDGPKSSRSWMFANYHGTSILGTRLKSHRRRLFRPAVHGGQRRQIPKSSSLHKSSTSSFSPKEVGKEKVERVNQLLKSSDRECDFRCLRRRRSTFTAPKKQQQEST